MEDFVRELLYPFIGWVYLWIKYRNKEKIKTILKEEYDGRYENVGSIKVLQFIRIIMIILLGAFLLVIIYRTIIPLKS